MSVEESVVVRTEQTPVLNTSEATVDLTKSYVDAPYNYEVLDGVTHWIPEAADADLTRLLLEFLHSPNTPVNSTR